MSFQKSSEALKNQGIKSQQREFRKRFKFIKKNKDRFYLVYIPNVEGYENVAIPYHQNLGELKIRNIHTGKETTIYLNSRCHDGKEECFGCLASNHQRETHPNFKSDTSFWKVDKSQRVGHFAVVYEALLREDSNFEFPSKDNLPQLIEYQYRYGKSDDWDNLVDVMSSIIAEGGDPTNPAAAAVIRVSKKSVPSQRGNTLKTVYVHEDTKKRIALPADWKTSLIAHDKILNTHFNFSSEDLQRIVEINSAMDAVRKDSTKGEVEKQNEINELTMMLKEVSNADFVALIEALHTKEEKEEGGKFGGQNGQNSAMSKVITEAKADFATPSYTQAAAKPLTETSQAPQAQAPAPAPVQAPAPQAPAPAQSTAQPHAQPPAQAEAAGGASKPMSALDRLRLARAASSKV
jgi:hypothetical protein